MRLPFVAALTLTACTSAPPPLQESAPAGSAPVTSAPLPPSRERSRLEAFVGTYTVSAEAVITPGGPLVPLATGTAAIEWTLRGRFLRWSVVLEIGDQLHESVGYLGYDEPSRSYQSLWLSDLASSMTLLTGGGNPSGAGLVVRGSSRGASGSRKMRVLDDDTLLVEGFAKNPAGGDTLLRRSRYVRR